jgi:8-oxo-dGTP diphosphatase
MTKTVTCVDVHGDTFEVSASSLEWRPSVYAIIVKDGKILLSKQFGDKYDLPGGGLDLGESFEDAVIREVKEETGIAVQNPQLVGGENSFFKSTHANGKTYHSILLYFVCEYVGGELSTDGFDEYEQDYAELAEWIPLEKLDSLQLASTVDYRRHIKTAIELYNPDIDALGYVSTSIMSQKVRIKLSEETNL